MASSAHLFGSSRKEVIAMPPDSLTLSEFLWQSPLFHSCHFDDDAKHAILERCYQMLWHNDTSAMLNHFFESQDTLKDDIDRIINRNGGRERAMEAEPTSRYTNSVIPQEDLSGQSARQCGHVFDKGEPVYRCRDCGLDDTCVFCSNCFRATNHDGHNVLFSVSPGSGGCCDCGDPEAWKVPLQCSIHCSVPNISNQEPAEVYAQIEPELQESIRRTITTVLNYMLDVFALAPDEVALPKSTEDLLSENRSERRTLSRMGIPHRLATQTSLQTTTLPGSQSETSMDVDMDKENTATHRGGEPICAQSKPDQDEFYSCIVWNDEAHALSHGQETIMSATGCSPEKARIIVNNIHSHGRAVIADSTDVEELRKIAQPLANIGLGVTIRPARDIFREHICGLLVDWLKDLVTGPRCFFPSLPNGDAIIRTILSEELCSRWELPLPLAIFTTGQRPVNIVCENDDEDDLGDDASDPNEDIVMNEPDGSTAGQIHVLSSTSSSSSSPVMYRNQRDVATIDWDPAAMVKEYYKLKEEEKEFDQVCFGHRDSANTKLAAGKKVEMLSQMTFPEEVLESSRHVQQEFEEKLRLDYFMLYDLKLWKEIRISFRQLYIATLSSNRVFKKILGKRLARNYSRLAESFLLKDREPENSIILFSVQLLTVPSVSDVLVNDYHFFGVICSTLTAFFLTDHLFILLPSERDRQPARINCESRAFRTRRYFNAFHDLRYIMNVELIKRALAEDPLYLRQYLDLISLFQGMNAQTCQKDTHVEYESEIWVNAFNVTLQIAKCCRQFVDCFSMLPLDSFEDRVAAAKVLVLALARVLKKIDDWTTEPDDSTEVLDPATKKPNNPSLAEPGTTAQSYHSVTFKNTETMKIVKHDVASELVSFHHPLHWLLAGLLEYTHILDDDVLREAGWSGGFLQAIMLFKASASGGPSQTDSIESLLPILDFSVRTIVFSSQVRAGVWVRNGYGIKNQASHYREISLRENTFDADVFLLQLGFVTVDPSQFLATLLDRFNLVAWFSGNRDHELYDTAQKSQMVEELLNLLIVCVCERANVYGMSLQDKIRREIIHVLALRPYITHSELEKSTPERMSEHITFDAILKDVAHFKSPNGIQDEGQYSLKDEYFEQVDTFFWHYSTNDREEAKTVLKNRWKKAHPDRLAEEFFIVPKATRTGAGPFRHLGELLHTSVFAQMIAYSLWNVQVDEAHTSETVLDQTLHLVALALVDENHKEESTIQGFRHHVHSAKFPFQEADEVQECSLFDVLLMLRKEDRLKEFHSRIEWMVDNLMTSWPEPTQKVIQQSAGYQALHMPAQSKEAGEDTELTDYEKKKKLAMERQKKIIAQFAQAQSQFAEQNQDMYDEDDEDLDQDLDSAYVDAHADPPAGQPGSIQRNYAYPTGSCIVCQEDVNERSQSYGLLGFLQTSNIWREVPKHRAGMLSLILTKGANMNVEWEDMQMATDSVTSGFPAEKHKSGLYASTCGHLMHLKCFDSYCASIESRHTAQQTRNHPEDRERKEFVCPLCKSLGNILLPIFWKYKKESFPGVIPVSGDAAYDQFLRNDIQNVFDKLKKSITPGRTGSGQRRAMSSASKLKESIATLVPSFRASPTALVDMDDGRPALIPSLEQSEELLTRNNPGFLPLATLRMGLGPFDDDTLHSTMRNPGTAQYHAAAVGKSYKGLLDVLTIIHEKMCVNELMDDDSKRKAKQMLEDSAKVNKIDLLLGMLGYTIASVEIATRGAEPLKDPVALPTGTLCDKIPPQMQTLLRVACDTVLAYTSLAFQEDVSRESYALTLLHMMSLGRLKQIFVQMPVDDVVHLSNTGQALEMYDNGPLLEDDPFMILAELSLHLVPLIKVDVYPLLRILLLAELTKTVAGLLQTAQDQDHEDSTPPQQNLPDMSKTSCPQSQVDAVKAFSTSVLRELNFTDARAQEAQGMYSDTQLCAVVKFFALPFLRRALLLMIVRFGYIVQEDNVDPAGDEVDHLLKVLGLPAFDHLLAWTVETNDLVKSWCKHFSQESNAVALQFGAPIEIALNMPTPLYLIALPERLNQLADESMRRQCNQCCTVPSESALCLLCGTFVCVQSFCCTVAEEGECNLHMAECGGEVGLFLWVKKSTVILLYNGNGLFIDAPYINPHGQSGSKGLKRGLRMELTQRRYADLRKLWLQHGIPINVARHIEASYDIGGWTTL